MASVKTCDPVKLHDMAHCFNDKAEKSYNNKRYFMVHRYGHEYTRGFYNVDLTPVLEGFERLIPTLTLGITDDACTIFDVHNAFEQILKGLEFLNTTEISRGHELHAIYAKIQGTDRRNLSKIYHEQELEGRRMIRKDPPNVQKRKVIRFPNTFECFLSCLDEIKAYTQRYSYQENVIYQCDIDFEDIFGVFKHMYNYSVRRWAPSMSGTIDASNLHIESIIDIVKRDGTNYADEQGNCILLAHEPKRKSDASFRSRYIRGVEEYFSVQKYRFNMDDTASNYYNYNEHAILRWDDCVNKLVLPFTVENCSSKEQAVKALKKGKEPLFYPAFLLDEVYSVGNDGG